MLTPLHAELFLIPELALLIKSENRSIISQYKVVIYEP